MDPFTIGIFGMLAALVLMLGLRAHVGATPRWARFFEVSG